MVALDTTGNRGGWGTSWKTGGGQQYQECYVMLRYVTVTLLYVALRQVGGGDGTLRRFSGVHILLRTNFRFFVFLSFTGRTLILHYNESKIYHISCHFMLMKEIQNFSFFVVEDNNITFYLIFGLEKYGFFNYVKFQYLLRINITY